MKRLSICLLLAISGYAYGQNVEATIRDATVEFNRAYENNELDKYFSYYADGATLWFTSGWVELEDYKSDWYELIAGGGGVEEARVSDLKIQVGPGGDTAIATYVADVVTRDADGNRSKERAWETDVWFKRDGEWKIAHIHYTSREVP